MRGLILTIGLLTQGAAFSSERQSFEKGLETAIDPLVIEGHLPAYYLSISDIEGVLFERGLGSKGNVDHFDPDSDTKFALLDLSKPLVAIAALKLWEEGRLELDVPISMYLPEFKKMSSKSSADDKAAIKVKDLFTHTAGFANNLDHKSGARGLSGSAAPKRDLFKTYQDKNLFTLKSLLSPEFEGRPLAIHVEELSTEPLLYEPGSSFEYSVSTEVLARIIELVSGQALDQALNEILFRPLGMKDTTFFLSPENSMNRASLMKPLIRTFPVPGNYQRYEPFPLPAGDIVGIGDRVNFLSGGGGLISTGGDMAKFAQLMLRILTSGGADTFLSDKSTPMIFENQLPKGLGNTPLAGKLPRATTDGLSLVFNIKTKQRRYTEIIKQADADYYYWSGFSSSVIWVDANRGLAGIFLSQLRPPQAYIIGDLIKITEEIDSSN